MTEPDERENGDVRELLGTALRGEPSTGLDPVRLMKLGRRRLRLQRASAALGVVVVAGSIALGAGLLRHNDDGAGPDRITAAATSPTTSPTVPTEPAQPTTATSIADTPPAPITMTHAAEIIAAQNAALKQVYPARNGMLPVTGVFAFTANAPVAKGYAGSKLSVRLGDRSGAGGFSLTATPIVGGGPSEMTCNSGKMTCAIQTINGISVEVETDHPTAKTTRILTVALSLSGNVLIDGSVDNIQSLKSTTATRPSPPLTADQLAHITAAIAKASP